MLENGSLRGTSARTEFIMKGFCNTDFQVLKSLNLHVVFDLHNAESPGEATTDILIHAFDHHLISHSSQ